MGVKELMGARPCSICLCSVINNDFTVVRWPIVLGWLFSIFLPTTILTKPTVPLDKWHNMENQLTAMNDTQSTWRQNLFVHAMHSTRVEMNVLHSPTLLVRPNNFHFQTTPNNHPENHCFKRALFLPTCVCCVSPWRVQCFTTTPRLFFTE